jgi:hypothetical protein
VRRVVRNPIADHRRVRNRGERVRSDGHGGGARRRNRDADRSRLSDPNADAYSQPDHRAVLSR